jgi:peptide/nickel transport system permease protein
MNVGVRTLMADVWRRPSGRAGLLILVGLVLTGLIGPYLVADPFAMVDAVGQRLLPPGPGHPFGTDNLSRDILARVVNGARISLSVATLAILLSATVGTAVGLCAGFFGGWPDVLLMRTVDAALAIPRIFVLLLLVALWEQIPLPALIAVLGFTSWFGTSRLVRAEALRIREEPFVKSAEALGASRRRIIFRHLLPNVLGPVLVSATLGVGDLILLEAGLSYFGLGMHPPTPSWGAMIHEMVASAPWTYLFPGLAIVTTVLSVNLVGEALRDAVDPRNA